MLRINRVVRSNQCESSSFASFREPGYQFFSSSLVPLLPPLFLFSGLSLFVCLLRARRRRRQAVWLVLGSPSRYYRIRYKNRRQPRHTIAVHSTGKETSTASTRGVSWTTLSRPTRLFDLSYQFLPASLALSFPLDLPHLFLSLFLADCITLCRRQAVWPVYSSVASSPLPLSILIPFLAVHSSLAHLHRRYPRTRPVPVPVPRACAIPALRACAIRSSAPTVSFASQSFKTGTVPTENIYIATNTPFRRLIVFPPFSRGRLNRGAIKPRIPVGAEFDLKWTGK